VQANEAAMMMINAIIAVFFMLSVDYS